MEEFQGGKGKAVIAKEHDPMSGVTRHVSSVDPQHCHSSAAPVSLMVHHFEHGIQARRLARRENSDISPRSKGRGKATVVASRKKSTRWCSCLLSF